MRVPTLTWDDQNKHEVGSDEQVASSCSDSNNSDSVTSQETDVIQQLLVFSARVSRDIQHYFNRTRGSEDWCDIYEDRFVSVQSGRELYYADLLAIAQFGDKKHGIHSREKHQPIIQIWNGDLPLKIKSTGARNKKAGLGPFRELFEIGLKNRSNEKLVEQEKQGTPLQERILPKSFWQEPGSSANEILRGSLPPDFSDLLETWTMN